MEQGTSGDDETAAPAPIKLCECGCGTPAPIAPRTSRKRGWVKGQACRFVAGHYGRFTAAERAAQRALEAPRKVKLCECGCGEPAPIATISKRRYGYVKGQPMRFVAGHYNRFAAAERAARLAIEAAEAPPAEVKLCECGCGQPAPIAKRNDPRRGVVKGQAQRFVRWHRPGRKGPQEYNRKLILEADQRIGRSVVIDPEVAFPEPNGKTNRGARLRCDCGTEYVRRVMVIFRSPDTEACTECTRFADRTGLRFGKLTAIRRVGSREMTDGRTALWLCKCDCGNEATVTWNNLQRGHTRTCGCGRVGPRRGFALGEAAFNNVLRSYYNGAVDRGLDWNLTKDDFRRLTSLDCHYCGAPPSKVSQTSPTSGTYVYNGLDRMDNTLGYFLDNVVPCCRPCNFAKKDVPYPEWMAWIARLTSFQFFKPDVTPVRILM